MKCPDPEWYVYIENYNKKCIEKFNVFHSYNFLEGCIKAFRKYGKPDQIASLEREIKSWAMYSFWSKCEYEIVITAWTSISPEDRFKDLKVDVYNQLQLNWSAFFDYVVKHKAFFLRRRNKNA